ncbi:MAG: DUF1552 domain-containing protein [Gemmataceae bacterium]
MRFAVLARRNGFLKEWWAKGSGKDMTLGKVLEPLLPVREKLNFIRGLYNAEALIGSIHSCQTSNLLTGAHLAPNSENLLRHQLRPSDCGEDEGPDESAQPRARHRALDRGHPQELLDDLFFAHLVEFRDDADAARTVPRACLRPPLPR